MAAYRMRTLYLVVAGLFLSTVSGDALGSHQCPHHDGLASHGAPASMEHGGHTDGGSAPDHGPCTCVGQCNVASGLAVLVRIPDHLSGAALTISAAQPSPASRPVHPRTPYLIPFANAPPA